MSLRPPQGSGIPALCFVGLIFAGCNWPLVASLVGIAIITDGAKYSGFEVRRDTGLTMDSY